MVCPLVGRPSCSAGTICISLYAGAAHTVMLYEVLNKQGNFATRWDNMLQLSCVRRGTRVASASLSMIALLCRLPAVSFLHFTLFNTSPTPRVSKHMP